MTTESHNRELILPVGFDGFLLPSPIYPFSQLLGVESVWKGVERCGKCVELGPAQLGAKKRCFA